MVKRSLFNLRIYTTRRDVRNHYICELGTDFFGIHEIFFFTHEKARAEQYVVFS